MEGLLVAILVFGAVTLFVIALGNILKKDINIDKFKPNWVDYKENKKDKKISHSFKLGLKSILLILITSITSYFVVYMVTGVSKLALLGLLVGFIIPKLLTDSYNKKQHKLLTMQLEQTCEIMASVLRSGGGIVDALTRSAIEIKSPLREELILTANEIKLGLSNGEAFENFSNRLSFGELKILSMAINLQQEGMAVNLGALLNQIQNSLRYKIAFQREVTVITAENRLAGWIVSALPFVTLAIMRVMIPDIIFPLFTTPIGITIFITAVSIIGLGIVWLMKIADVKV